MSVDVGLRRYRRRRCLSVAVFLRRFNRRRCVYDAGFLRRSSDRRCVSVPVDLRRSSHRLCNHIAIRLRPRSHMYASPPQFPPTPILARTPACRFLRDILFGARMCALLPRSRARVLGRPSSTSLDHGGCLDRWRDIIILVRFDDRFCIG